jgi:ABC-type multidrug transport system ATPase subunit
MAVRSVDLEVHAGEILGLIGPNGAGKTTLFNLVTGVYRPSAGNVYLDARDITRLPPAQRCKLGVARTFQLVRPFQNLTVLENVAIGRIYGRDAARSRKQADAEALELLELVGLAEARSRRVEAMSKGMQQRLGIAQALVGAPRVLLLDEPTSALDPAGRRTIRGLLAQLRERGIAVLLNSHLLTEVELVCDRVVILSHGRVAAAGRPDELSEARGIEVDTGSGVRRYPEARREDAPRIVRELVAAGDEVYGVRVLATTLEEVYLSAVTEETGV